ncbi:MAG TPA: hypothetical protein DD405_02815, partial [Desulfobacteraceae bacterium]|nr:hypothetical protein [Desulfobacteraceae bacterium]
MGKLDGRSIVITGSGRGLGKGFAIEMAKEGASVVVNDIDDSANEVVNEIKAQGGKAAAVIAGVGTKEVAEKLVNTAVSEFGKIDVMINNAGILRDGFINKMKEQDFDDVITVHLKAAFL